jgi:hypothetical protein
MTDVARHVIHTHYEPSFSFSQVTSYDMASSICQAHCSPQHPPQFHSRLNPRFFGFLHVMTWRAMSDRPWIEEGRFQPASGLARRLSDQVGQCRLSVSKPVLKALMESALEARI